MNRWWGLKCLFCRMDAVQEETHRNTQKDECSQTQYLNWRKMFLFNFTNMGVILVWKVHRFDMILPDTGLCYYNERSLNTNALHYKVYLGVLRCLDTSLQKSKFAENVLASYIFMTDRASWGHWLIALSYLQYKYTDMLYFQPHSRSVSLYFFLALSYFLSQCLSISLPKSQRGN